MHTRIWIAAVVALAVADRAGATTYAPLDLHARVQVSDTIVLARVVDPNRGLMTVERVLKGTPPKQITLVSYIDPFIVAEQRRPLALNDRELLFLTRKGDAYAPVQQQHGRLRVNGDRLVDSFRREPRSLAATLASIDRLVAFQGHAAGSDRDADAVFVSALKHADVELQLWALATARNRLKTPSRALVDAALARWPRHVPPIYGPWNAAGLIANMSTTWRIRDRAPFFARILTTSTNGDERAWAAMALGGTSDRTYLPLLRRIATGDPHEMARALAFRGIVVMIGPESLPDLRLGAKDGSDHVRAQVVVDAYNMLELQHPEPRWPAPTPELIASVRKFLTEMLRDPVPYVSDNARSMLRQLATGRP